MASLCDGDNEASGPLKAILNFDTWLEIALFRELLSRHIRLPSTLQDLAFAHAVISKVDVNNDQESKTNSTRKAENLHGNVLYVASLT
ncbi:hypothetical protein ANN_10334 [Periplaneta americana]|uniref:Uncharacterized protein n=1 Tax=Periplaneta americana TaxID=6978 RepID=A0ABQ8TP39_PERAM|nr:hypothetical protein ANN_10334 [Periplaneta americana]